MARPQLVLIGGGHAHALVLESLIARPIDADVTVIVDRPIAIYSGMVPGYVAGQYRVDELQIDVPALAARAGVRTVLQPVRCIDAVAHRIEPETGEPLPYDLASINIGSTVAGLDLPGVREHAVPTRPIAEFIERIDALIDGIGQRDGGDPCRIVVVGGGAGGVEVAFSLDARLKSLAGPPIEVTLLNRSERIIEGYPEGLVRRVERHAATRGVRVLNRTRVDAVTADSVQVDSGERLPSDAVVWVTGAVSHPLFRNSGLPTDPRGFVRIRSTLQLEEHDDVFAVGDCGTFIDYPRTPKAGVYAVRQGPILADNLRASLAGRPLQTYTPQPEFLTLLNLGDGRALGVKRSVSFEGRWVMRLKDCIDRAFMKRFQ
ncbi:MAG: FAD-dependent oxidoreductase [Vicinamibacterales bacterium]|jgi:selenide,water dikinase|nr:pyridine nucleotide-disulfide oxidoreductase [Acidobacteriota bacterium]MDP6371098.1 FAD-dependent oxidoreductase [Vicinamibacterales bacterium]MDP6607628.1 FAD-dependent oxidoreductase [Vicinamibacterales bacterium]